MLKRHSFTYPLKKKKKPACVINLCLSDILKIPCLHLTNNLAAYRVVGCKFPWGLRRHRYFVLISGAAEEKSRAVLTPKLHLRLLLSPQGVSRSFYAHRAAGLNCTGRRLSFPNFLLDTQCPLRGGKPPPAMISPRSRSDCFLSSSWNSRCVDDGPPRLIFQFPSFYFYFLHLFKKYIY